LNVMKVPYSTTDPGQNELDSLPWVPLVLRKGEKMVHAAGLLDSGATVNVLPYRLGIHLGAVWDSRKAVIHLAGNLGNIEAQPLFVMGEIGAFPPVKLAFAWTLNDEIPLILGQMNFFMEFDVCFYRSRLEFDVKPISR
jgi:hypothetical protein